MSDRRFPDLTPETMTDEQRQVADAIQSGPRGAGLRGPFSRRDAQPATLRSGATRGCLRAFRQLDPAGIERTGDLAWLDANGARNTSSSRTASSASRQV